jgi:hypothetical protein
MSQPSFFDCEYQLDKINQINDFLFRLDDLIDGSVFLDLLNQVRSSKKKSNAERSAFDGTFVDVPKQLFTKTSRRRLKFPFLGLKY